MIDTFYAKLGGLKSEDGYTLIEMLIAASIVVVVVAAILAFLDVSQRTEARDTERALSMQQARVGLSQMTRELRQASSIKKAEANAITFVATITTPSGASTSSKQLEITYNCAETNPEQTAYHECVRKAYVGASLVSSGPLIRDIAAGTEVFKYFEGASSTAEPSKELERITSVTLKVRTPLQGTLKQVDSSGYKGDNILEDAAFLRNRYPEG